MRSPDDDLLQPVNGLLYVAAVIALVRASRPSVSCSIQQDHALQTPQAEWTNVIAERETVLIFGYRHRLAARRENIPYKVLVCRIFSSCNWKRTQHTRHGLSNLVTAICSLPADVRNGSNSEVGGRNRKVRLKSAKLGSGSPSIRSPRRRGQVSLAEC
jgi:hypothetical protein